MKKASYILLFLFTILHLKNSAQNVKNNYNFNSDCDILYKFFCNDAHLNYRNLNVILINNNNDIMLNHNFAQISSLRYDIDKILRKYNFRHLESIKKIRPFFLIALLALSPKQLSYLVVQFYEKNS